MPMLFDPFEQLRDFQRALDAFRSSSWLGTGLSAGGAYPPINVFRRGDDIVAIIEVPGVRKSDLDIKIERNTLRISGSKSVEYGDKAAMHRRERLAGRFDRAVTLPISIDADKIRAECRDGILALYLPRAERDKPRSITVS
jgi:HSP20 family protein